MTSPLNKLPPQACPVTDAMLAEKDRLDRISLDQSYSNDPVELLVGTALYDAGFTFQHEGHPERAGGPTLDFKLADDLYIEVKRFHTPRIEKQMAQVENVIVIQGIAAARWFAAALASRPQEPTVKVDQEPSEVEIKRVAIALMCEAGGDPRTVEWCSEVPWYGAARAALAALRTGSEG